MADNNRKRQIVELSDADLQKIVENAESENTKRLTKQSVKMFKEYLAAKNLDRNFEQYEPDQLDQTLSKFYAEIRDKNGQMYKRTTLQSYRQGIQRHLQSVRSDNIDIVKGSDFVSSKKVFGWNGRD